MRNTRDGEKRDHERREQHSMEYLSPLSLPPGSIKDGYHPHWANVAIRGYSSSNVSNLARLGFEPVPKDRIKVNFNFDPLKQNPLSEHYICSSDCILMEIPEHLYQDLVRRRNETATAPVRSLQGVTTDTGSLLIRNSSNNSF
jgi:hypothetical protein